jgi:DNA polymerase III subunit epsilon
VTWWEQSFIVLDTETDSANPEQARLVSICRAVINPAERSKDVHTSYVAIEMPEAASKVNGLTTEFLAANGKPPADVLDEYCSDLAASLALGVPVVIMNAPYDLTVLDRDCRRNGVPTISDRLDGAPLGPIVDPGVLDKKVERFRRRVSPTQGARCLKTLAQVHGIGWDDDLAHTAEYEAQVGWYAEQAESLAQFFRKKANQVEFEARRASDAGEQSVLAADAAKIRDDADSVTLDWPMHVFEGD